MRTPTSPLSEEAEQKKRFLLFIKILFKSLDQDSEVREVARNIVSDCTRRNRLGDPLYSPLMDAIYRRLRGYVGEARWRRASMYTQHYMKQGGIRARRPKYTFPASIRREEV
jgi:hypothetical protein